MDEESTPKSVMRTESSVPETRLYDDELETDFTLNF
jgi:hypothetical protein